VKQCPQCQKIYDDAAILCQYDGSPLLAVKRVSDSSADTLISPPEGDGTAPPPGRRWRPPPLVLAAGLIFLTTSIIFLWWFLGRQSPGDGPNPPPTEPTPRREAPADKLNRDKILGVWSNRDVDADGFVTEGETTFMVGGKVTYMGSMTDGEKVLPLVSSGNWEVKDGHIHSTIETSNLPEIFPKGFTYVEKIISVDDKELITELPSGERLVYTRKKS